MDIDWKRFTTAMLACLLILFGWQWYNLKYGPQPQVPAQQGQPAGSNNNTSNSVVNTSTNTNVNDNVANNSNSNAPQGNTAKGNKYPAGKLIKPTGIWHLVAVNPDSAKAGTASNGTGNGNAPGKGNTGMAQAGEEIFGSLKPNQKEEHPFKAEIIFNNQFAGPQKVLLSEYKFKITDKTTGYPLMVQARDDRGTVVYPMMLGQLKLAGRVETFDLSRNCWKLLSKSQRVISREDKTTNQADQNNADAQANQTQLQQTVKYSATIADSNNRPVLQIIKTFTYSTDNYDLDFNLQFVNKSPKPLRIEYLQMYGPTGILREDPRSDRRRATVAYSTAQGVFKVINQNLSSIISDPQKGLFSPPINMAVKWVAVSNKFFTAVVCPEPTGRKTVVDYIQNNSVIAQPLNTTINAQFAQTITTQMNLTQQGDLLPNAADAYNFKIYMGPIDKSVFDMPQYANLHFDSLYAGRSCSFCTFQWLTFLILNVLTAIYHLVHNYGIAIIILVLVVRLVLHPITKKSQVNMMKMSKLGPKIEEIKKQYAGQKEEIQKRTMQVYKEHGLAGGMLLGCLPMLLQMPIWIALYTAVDSNVALRHHGLFPVSWHWLTDLTVPDRLVPFSAFGVMHPIAIPLLGNVDAFNLLPILLCIAMFLQTKYSPQTKMTQATNPQAAQQQKMMLYMMPAMMLIFFYNAPSGLNLYIMASTFGGLVEQHYIRKHIQQQQEIANVVSVESTAKVKSKVAPKKKKPKPPIRYN